ncbi:MAG TPA: hypothetical protein VFF33_13785 [Ignavibacteriaceae bacterium]|nr:hypothetical protein [Ignavibacteriaceae bacterium]
MCKYFMFFFVLVINSFIFPLNAPTNFTAIGCNGYVKLMWTNADSYTSIKVYRDGTLYETLSGSAINYEDKNKSTFLPRHIRHSYFIKGYRNGAGDSPATSSCSSHSIRTAYVKEGGMGDEDGSNYWDAFNIDAFQNNTSDGGSGWFTANNFVDGDGNGYGFWKGDSIIVCGSSLSGGSNSMSEFILSKNPDFPRNVYSGQTDKLLFISRHLVENGSTQATIGYLIIIEMVLLRTVQIISKLKE